MPFFVVRLGTPRRVGEGLRIGTVRFPPRGVPKEARAREDWFDLWYPNLAPSAQTLRAFRGAGDTGWHGFERAYRREMTSPEHRRTLELLAALSHHAAFSVGCYCADETRCHRRILRELLLAAGAQPA
ncbi:MAG: DUF488 domain-containing protein [Gammaproteobacteria bacterium]